MNAKILVVDDEQPIADILKFSLEKEGFQVVCAADGQEALHKARTENPDLMLLDIMLPVMDGMEVCRNLRMESNMPIIMLTAKDSEIDKVLGLEFGADDYVTKPFGVRELVARVKANLRRNSSEPRGISSSTMKIGPFEIDAASYIVTKRGELIDLTHREFELFHYMAKHTGQVMTREHLLQTVWGFDYFGDVRTVDVTIRRMREKMEDDPSHPEWILTRRGLGYTMRNPKFGG